MTYDEVPALYRDTWALYDALRRLGFADEQVTHHATAVVYPDGTAPGGDHMVIVLEVGGNKCTFIVGRLDRSFEEARDLLERIRAAIRDHSIDDATLDRLWKTSAMGVRENFQSVAITILNKGIAIPVFVN